MKQIAIAAGFNVFALDGLALIAPRPRPLARQRPISRSRLRTETASA